MKKHSNIIPAMIGILYTTDGKDVWELIMCQAEPHVSFMKIPNHEEKSGAISLFKDFVRLIPEVKPPSAPKRQYHRKAPAQNDASRIEISSGIGEWEGDLHFSTSIDQGLRGSLDEAATKANETKPDVLLASERTAAKIQNLIDSPKDPFANKAQDRITLVIEQALTGEKPYKISLDTAIGHGSTEKEALLQAMEIYGWPTTNYESALDYFMPRLSKANQKRVREILK